MGALRELQNDFQAYLLGAPSAARTRIASAGSLNAEARLQVYAEAYRLRLLEALETDFVALRAHLGEDGFNRLGDAYIAARPSRHYSLRYFGQHLADFLRSAPPYADSPLLAELAAFDWALTNAFDAPDEPVLPLESMTQVDPNDWPNLTFRALAAVARMDLQWNAPAIWKAAEAGEETLPDPERSGDPVAWVIWRQDLNTYFRSLDSSEAYALDALMRGESFGAICEGLCAFLDAEEVAGVAARFLRQWIVDGMLREFAV